MIAIVILSTCGYLLVIAAIVRFFHVMRDGDDVMCGE